MKIPITLWNNTTHTLALTTDPRTTKIHTLKTLLIASYKASLYESALKGGERILRDTLPVAAITLTMNDCELADDRMVVDCGIVDTDAGDGMSSDTMIHAHRADYDVTRKRYGKGGFEGRLEERMKSRRKKSQRRSVRREVVKVCESVKSRGEGKKRQSVDEADADADVGMLEQEQDGKSEAELEVFRYSGIAEEEEGREEMKREIKVWEDASQASSFQIMPESHEQSEFAGSNRENPDVEEDHDKENWNPQILREIVRNEDGVLARREEPREPLQENDENEWGLARHEGGAVDEGAPGGRRIGGRRPFEE